MQKINGIRIYTADELLTGINTGKSQVESDLPTIKLYPSAVKISFTNAKLYYACGKKFIVVKNPKSFTPTEMAALLGINTMRLFKLQERYLEALATNKMTNALRIMKHLSPTISVENGKTVIRYPAAGFKKVAERAYTLKNLHDDN